MKKYVERGGWVERVWKVVYPEYVNGFDFVIYVRGTEYEMHDYLDSEIGYVGRYHALNDNEVNQVSKLGMNIYICPQLKGGV